MFPKRPTRPPPSQCSSATFPPPPHPPPTASADHAAAPPYEAASESMLKRDVSAALDTLSARERLVLQLRFGLGQGHQHTLAEVGEQLQISRERVRQIENEALQKLRRLDGDRLYAYHQEL